MTDSWLSCRMERIYVAPVNIFSARLARNMPNITPRRKKLRSFDTCESFWTTLMISTSITNGESAFRDYLISIGTPLQDRRDVYSNHSLCVFKEGTYMPLIDLWRFWVIDGYITDEHDDPYIKSSSMVLDQFAEAAAPGKWLVDLIPIRKLIWLLVVHLSYIYNSHIPSRVVSGR